MEFPESFKNSEASQQACAADFTGGVMFLWETRENFGHGKTTASWCHLVSNAAAEKPKEVKPLEFDELAVWLNNVTSCSETCCTTV